jgi:hypothetical protein
MNRRSELMALKDWKDLELNSLTLTLTPALSLGERENSLPRIGNMRALDLTRFRGSMREMVRGILIVIRILGFCAAFRAASVSDFGSSGFGFGKARVKIVRRPWSAGVWTARINLVAADVKRL